MTSTERPAAIYWCSCSLLLLLHLSSNSATHNRTSLDNHYLNILYWSICSQCISSRFIPSFTMTKAAHCNLNMPLPGPQETCTDLSLCCCCTDMGNLQQSWRKSLVLPVLKPHPIHFYIKSLVLAPWIILYRWQDFYMSGYHCTHPRASSEVLCAFLSPAL